MSRSPLPPTASIDGLQVELRPGDKILDAVRRAGASVPTLCHRSGLQPEGSCRLCLVESERGLLGACHTPLWPGATIRTATERLERMRSDLLALQLSAHPAGLFQPDPEGDELERLLARYGVDHSPLGHAKEAVGEVDSSHPYLHFDPQRCITCRRCEHACDEIQGQFVYSVAGRGAATRLVFGPSQRFADSPCVACGACVDVCPSTALYDLDRPPGRVAGGLTTRSVCGYCGVGCRIEIWSHEDRVERIGGVADAAVNRGHLCLKGRYAHAYHRSVERLRKPLLRDGEDWRELDWPAAIDWLAKRLTDLRDHHGPDSLGALTSSRSTNEAAYLLQKLFRRQIGTNNVDCCARVCHSSTALALQLTTGTGAASASYDDLERARAIVVAGANPTEAHPVIGARIRQAVLAGVPLLVIDPRRIELVEIADLHLQLQPGSNVAVFNAIAGLLFASDGVDRGYLAARVEGVEDFERFVRHRPLAEAVRVSGVAEADLRRAAELLAAGPALFVHGLGLSELTQGTASVMALCNLGMVTGSIGRRGAGMLPLRGQNNVQGNADMGGMPNQVTGYQALDDPLVRHRLRQVWGEAPPETPGLTLPEMLDAARSGEIRGLWIQGEDIAQSEPDERRVMEALDSLELLVVQELFLTETARHAHLVLPAASALEQDGTFTNGERRIQRVRPAVAPPGEARPDWRVVRDVATALGEGHHPASPAAVMEEIAQVAPELFGGVSYDRLSGDGLQWPCPDPAHPGTATVHGEGFLRGRGLLTMIDFAPSPELGVEGYPYLLITGRVLEHYNVGTMTRRTPNRRLVAEDWLEIHPEDAGREDLADGQEVVIESRWGKAQVRARHSKRMLQGTLFLSFHFPTTHTNRLTGPQLDPHSKCPEYKITATRLRP